KPHNAGSILTEIIYISTGLWFQNTFDLQGIHYFYRIIDLSFELSFGRIDYQRLFPITVGSEAGTIPSRLLQTSIIVFTSIDTAICNGRFCRFPLGTAGYLFYRSIFIYNTQQTQHLGHTVGNYQLAISFPVYIIKAIAYRDPQCV